MDNTSFRDVPQIEPGVDIIPKGRVKNRVQLFNFQASHFSSASLPLESNHDMQQGTGIQVSERKTTFFEKNDSKLSNESDLNLLSVESQSHSEVVQVEEKNGIEIEEATEINLKVSLRPIAQQQHQHRHHYQPSFNNQLKNHFNLDDKNLMFLPVKDTNEMDATNECNKSFSSFYMVGKERIEKRIDRLGLLPKLNAGKSFIRSFIFQSKFASSFTSTNLFPFFISPKHLASFLVHRDACFWKAAKTCFANEYRNGEEAKHVFDNAINKHNRLYEFFKNQLFHTSLSSNQLKANIQYFMNLLIYLLKQKSYSLFFTCTQLLIDLNLKDQIHFQKKQLSLFYTFSAILNCCKFGIDTAKSERPSSIPLSNRFPFNHLDIVLDPKFQLFLKKKEQLESYFEMIF